MKFFPIGSVHAFSYNFKDSHARVTFPDTILHVRIVTENTHFYITKNVYVYVY